MLHALMEALPFFAGIALGLATHSRLPSGTERWWITGLGSIALGVANAALAGELSGDIMTAITAACLDSAAAAVGWVGCRFLLVRWRTVR